MWVENRSDELWIGVKGQSSSEIAGSPRNVSWYGLENCSQEVEHCMGEGPVRDTESKQTPNACRMDLGRQTLCDNVQRREGKNPDRRLRSRSAC
jgi:hypothetical protein